MSYSGPVTQVAPDVEDKPLLYVDLRWLIRRDMQEVLDIESKSFAFPWTAEDFLLCLKERNVIGMVAESGDEIVGFMIYELLKSQLHVLNFAVCPTARRRHVGSQMVAKLISKLSKVHRQQIVLEVRETNLNAQKFFRNQCLKATGILRNHYEDSDEDAYVMRLDL